MPDDQPLNLPHLLDSRLAPGESVTWQGAPASGEMARRSLPMAFVGAAGVVALGCWLVAVVDAYQTHSASAGTMALSLLFAGLPVLVFSAVMLIAPWSAMARAKRTLYAITDRRVVVMHGPGEGGMQSFDATSIGDVAVKSPGRTTSDVTFSYATSPDRTGGREVVLRAVANAADVANRLAGLGEPE